MQSLNQNIIQQKMTDQIIITVLIIGVAAATLAFLRSPVVGTRAVGLAFLASALIGIMPESFFAPAKLFSGVWFFRDPMVFFGLLAGGVVLQRGIQARRIQWRFVTVVLLGAQLLQQASAVRPAFDQVAGRGGPLRFYRDQKTPVRLASTVVDRARDYGPRLYTSDPVRLALRGGMSSSGIHSITDLVFFGVNPVNGWFKNVSMDRLYPSAQLMHGIIFGQRDVIAHQPLLNVLGINLIWATAADGPFPPGLVATDRWHSGSRVGYLPEQHDFVLLGNPQAWPRAVLLREGIAHARVPVRPGCLHRRALCRDFSSLEQQRLPGKVELQEENGLYNARFPQSREPRLLFISATYRPEWQAISAAGPLPIEPVASAFWGVRSPAGVEAVEIRFNPRVRMILTWISSVTLLSLLAIVGVGTWRRWRAAVSPSS